MTKIIVDFNKYKDTGDINKSIVTDKKSRKIEEDSNPFPFLSNLEQVSINDLMDMMASYINLDSYDFKYVDEAKLERIKQKENRIKKKFDAINEETDKIKEHVNSMQDINLIRKLKKPKDFVDDVKEMNYLYETYKSENGKIMDGDSRIIGRLIQFDYDTITIKLTEEGKKIYDDMESHFVSVGYRTARDLDTGKVIIIDIAGIIITEGDKK